MRTVKQVALVALGVFLAVLILQNTAPVRMQFLWLAGEMPAIVLLFLTATGGFAMGIIVALLWKGRTGSKSELPGDQGRGDASGTGQGSVS
ncbi:MAG: LapA family protein [Pelovirga sp.]